MALVDIIVKAELTHAGRASGAPCLQVSRVTLR